MPGSQLSLRIPGGVTGRSCQGDGNGCPSVTRLRCPAPELAPGAAMAAGCLLSISSYIMCFLGSILAVGGQRKKGLKSPGMRRVGQMVQMAQQAVAMLASFFPTLLAVPTAPPPHRLWGCLCGRLGLMPGRMCTTASVQGGQGSAGAGFQVQANGKEGLGVEPVGGLPGRQRRVGIGTVSWQ